MGDSVAKLVLSFQILSRLKLKLGKPRRWRDGGSEVFPVFLLASV